MEVLDEYDNEFPQSVTFCQLISEEDFERQAATYTERALRRLFRALDRNPALAERVVRKGKQTEMEQSGLLSGLWGELNQCNSMGALEMHQRLEQLKWRIHRVHLYSRGAKKRRRRRLKPKRAADPVIFRDRSTSPCLPPAPLPPPLPPPPLPVTTMASVVAASPPVYTMPRVFGPFPPLSGKPMEKLDISRSEVKLNWNSLSSTSKSHMVDLTPLVLNPGGFHFSYLAGNNAHKLHCPGFPCVGDGAQDLIHARAAASCSEPSSTNEAPSPVVKASIFTPPVLLKFQPVPRPKDNSETFQPVPRPKDDSEMFQPVPRPKDDSETFQPVPRPKDDSENDPGSAESIPAKKSE
ncbi:uncharacterized protein [Alexandromys fortis]|uniref:uncharacterized protein isoform X2 n=1 Tax=Alexandromys fortis TaxID=100897 RepID=UPI0021534923|nr:uncharacterized protein LOC126489047 isoform X2 [Microtus fortis]